MDIKKLGMLQFLFVLLFSFTTSLAFAGDDDVTAVSAGADQVVGLGETVSLTGVLAFEEDDDDKKKHRHKSIASTTSTTSMKNTKNIRSIKNTANTKNIKSIRNIVNIKTTMMKMRLLSAGFKHLVLLLFLQTEIH